MRSEMSGHNPDARGFTLVELMVSMLIGLVLLSGIYGVFISSSDSYRRLQGLASIQERGRITMNVLRDTIQMTDYTGCRTSVAINNVLTNSANYEFNFGQGIQGFDSTGTAWLPAIEGSIPFPLAAGAAVTTAAHAGSGENSSASLSTAYGTEATVVKLGSVSFFIRNNTDGIRSLWWKEGAASAQEIIEGVDGMQVLYGVTSNTDTSANQYLTADAVSVWGDVVSVRIGLLVATEKPVVKTQDTGLYSLLGVAYGPFNDFRLRRVFTTNIVLRNRSF